MTARAADTTILQPDITSEIAVELANVLASELDAVGVSSDTSDITLTELLAVSGCDDLTAACLDAVVETVGTPGVIWFDLDPSSSEPTVRMAWYQGSWPPQNVEHQPGGMDRGHLVAAVRLLTQPQMATVLLYTAPDAQVSVNGAAAVSANEAISVAEGTHVLTLSAPQRQDVDREVRVQSGDIIELEVDLLPDDTLQNPVEMPRAGTPPWLAPVGWTLVGVGGASMVGGVVTWVLMSKTEDELVQVTARRPLTLDDIDEAQSLQSTGKTLATTTDVLLFGGLGLAAIGATLIVVDLVAGEDTDDGGALSVQVGPAYMGVRASF